MELEADTAELTRFVSRRPFPFRERKSGCFDRKDPLSNNSGMDDFHITGNGGVAEKSNSAEAIFG